MTKEKLFLTCFSNASIKCKSKKKKKERKKNTEKKKKLKKGIEGTHHVTHNTQETKLK